MSDVFGLDRPSDSAQCAAAPLLQLEGRILLAQAERDVAVAMAAATYAHLASAEQALWSFDRAHPKQQETWLVAAKAAIQMLRPDIVA